MSRLLMSLFRRICFAACASGLLAAQSGPIVTHDFYHDTSTLVRDYASSLSTNSGPAFESPRPRPRQRPLPGISDAPDAAEQQFGLSPVLATLGLDFEGIPNAANGSLKGAPSDSNLSVGDKQVVEVINSVYQVYDKGTGKSLFPAQQISTIFTGMPGLCGQGVTFFFTDPIVLYDKIAGRWIISIVAGNPSFSVGNECIAVSTTSDATGRYHRYEFRFGNTAFNDYPKMSVWPDAYYASYNIFGPTSFIGARACAYDRDSMLAGKHAAAVCFDEAQEFSFLPSDLDGAAPPSNGEPNFFVDLFNSTSLHLFRFHVDFTTPSNSTFTGPLSITVKSFKPACNGGACIPQEGTKQPLDSLSDRLMFRLAYRNMSTHESLVVNHSVKTSRAAAGIRWYEIRDPNSTPTVFQEGTFTDESNSAWMASAGMDKVGDIAMGFSESSTHVHPRISFTGRSPGDPLNTMELPALIVQGNGSQIGVNRWGDYSGLSIDPADDCTFWYVNQYMPLSSRINFHTRVASFKFPACQ